LTEFFEISCVSHATDRSQTCPYGAVNEQLIRRGGSQTLPLSLSQTLPLPLSMVRDLCRVVERENAAMGVLLALEPPTKGMLSEASSAGRFQLPGAPRTFPKVQIFTVEDYFAGKRPDLPDTSDTITPLGGPRQKAKPITKPQTKPELGI